MSDRLFAVSGKVVLIAGAASGLGESFASVLAERGASLELVDRDFPLPDRQDDQSPQIRRHRLDITDETGVDALLAAIVRHRGRLDAVVNSAGVFVVAPARDLDLAVFRRTLDVNLTGAFVLSRAAARVMRGAGGRIVHLASVSSHVSNANYAAYASSKAGLTHLVKVLAREWAPDAITVNAIGPAMTETGLTSAHLADDAARRAALAVIPMGRFGTPEDLIGVLILLLSDAGRFITGQTIYVDGGRTLV